MHDATEAYLMDIPRPIKGYLGGYHDYEDRLWKEVCRTFDIAEELPQCVKDADNAVLLAEAPQVLGPQPAPWNIAGTPADVTVEFLGPRVAKVAFLNRFNALNERRAR